MLWCHRVQPNRPPEIIDGNAGVIDIDADPTRGTQRRDRVRVQDQGAIQGVQPLIVHAVDVGYAVPSIGRGCRVVANDADSQENLSVQL